MFILVLVQCKIIMEVDETLWDHQKKQHKSVQKSSTPSPKITTKIPIKSPTRSKVAANSFSKIPTIVKSNPASTVVYKAGTNMHVKSHGDIQSTFNTRSNRWQNQRAMNNQSGGMDPFINNQLSTTEQCGFGDVDCNDNTPVTNHDLLTMAQVSHIYYYVYKMSQHNTKAACILSKFCENSE